MKQQQQSPAEMFMKIKAPPTSPKRQNEEPDPKKSKEKEKKEEAKPCIKLKKTTKDFIKICFAAFTIISSICIGIAALVLHATPFYLFSGIPYLFMFAALCVCGLPEPFRMPNQGFQFSMPSELEETYKRWYHFFLGCMCPSPLVITILIGVMVDKSFTVSLVLLSNIFLITLFIVYFWHFFPPPSFKDEEEEIEMQLVDEDEEDAYF